MEQQRERPSIEELYAEYHDDVRLAVQKRVPSYMEGKSWEDVEQEVWEGVTKFYDRYEHIGKPFTMIYTILNRKIIDTYRVGERHPVFPSDDPPVPEVPEVDNNTSMYAEELLGECSVGQADVLRMHYLEGMTYPEIASSIVRTKEAARTRGRRGIATIRRKIGVEL